MASFRPPLRDLIHPPLARHHSQPLGSQTRCLIRVGDITRIGQTMRGPFMELALLWRQIEDGHTEHECTREEAHEMLEDGRDVIAVHDAYVHESAVRRDMYEVFDDPVRGFAVCMAYVRGFS